MVVAAREDVKTRLLDAALTVIRSKGYNAATVDDICRGAGVSKGAFFHYFTDKEALAIAAAEHFSQGAAALFGGAAYRDERDPRERLLQYIDLRAALVCGDFAGFTCLLGTMVQETYATHPAIRETCDEQIRRHAGDVAHDVGRGQARIRTRSALDGGEHGTLHASRNSGRVHSRESP